jgi:hypothetical protein
MSNNADKIAKLEAEVAALEALAKIAEQKK